MDRVAALAAAAQRRLRMSNILDDVPVNLTCDSGHKFVKTVAKLKAERAEYVREQLAAAEKSVADFARSVRGLSDKLK